MNHYLRIFLSFMLLGTILSAMTPLPHESLQFKELTLKIPEITRKILSNGMELFYAQDSSLPIVRATLYVPGGSHRDPAAATGLSSLLSTVQIAGGTRHLTPDELDMQLESLGAEIDTGAQSRYQTVSLKCLRTDFKNILDLFFEVALHPRFDPSRFDLEKKNALESIRRRDDDAAGIARRKFANIVYRPHPEGNETTMETIGSISRDNLINSHRKRFQPDGSQLLVVGDVDLKTLESMLSPYLAQWKPTGRKLVDPPKVTREFKAERYFVQKSVPQVKIRIGHKSIKLSNPDLFPLMVMDRILGGGGFNSRLMKRIRTELGLAYSVYSWIGADVFYSTIGVDCGTKTEGSVQSLREILSAIKKIQDQPVSNEELELARNTIVNQFVFKFATRHQVASRILFFEQAGLPDDFMETYLKAIEAVTVKDVQRVAREYFKSDGLKILLVGDFAKVRAEIEKEFGSFKEIKLPDYGSGSGKAGKSASLSR